jgi:hypothetical protein
MKTAQQVFTEAFSYPRDPRSEEYKAGVLEALRFRLGEVEMLKCPYRAGTAQADAWYAGIDEGHSKARAAMEADLQGRVV